MMKIVFFTLLIQVSMSFSFAFGQKSSTWINGEIRCRFIADDGYKCLHSENQRVLPYFSQRTRINLSKAAGEWQGFISLQDIRFWGDDNLVSSSGSFGNSSAINLHQAWVSYDRNSVFNIKFGRQIWQYDDQRIFSSRNWNDYQLTYDGILCNIFVNKLVLNFGFSWNAESPESYNVSLKKFKTVDFVRVEYIMPNSSLSTIGAYSAGFCSDTSEVLFHIETFGVNYKFDFRNFSGRVDNYFQLTAKNGNKTYGYCASFLLGWKIKKLELHLSGGFDCLSGEKNTSDRMDLGKYNLLYGRRHSYYGYLDYFNNLPDEGLCDLYFQIVKSYKSKNSIEVAIHYFLLNQIHTPENLNSNACGKSLGPELDFLLNRKVNSIVEISLGYSILKPTDILYDLKNQIVDDKKIQQYMYVVLSYKPEFFRQN
ncbi:MAG: alginate export family protein [Bacteroidales bacterium]|nr:alginate export family protein [Bacteroidales bacterium]